MTHDPIDQTLGNEPEITPSADFSWRVMRSVRREADQEAALPFPWKRLAASLAVSAALTLAAMLLADPPAPVSTGPPEQMVSALVWLTTALVAALGVAWWSLRLAARR